MSHDPWTLLFPGERFTIESRRGNPYDLTFLARSREPDGGIFVRFASDKLARFYPSMLNWSTLERVSSGSALVRGDEILVTPGGGAECRGRVSEASDDHIVLRLPDGQTIAVVLDDIVKGSLRLLMAATDWQAGDDFLVRSRSGRDYRGTTQRVSREKIDAILQGRSGLPQSGPISLRVDQLDLSSLRVLIPVETASLAPA